VPITIEQFAFAVATGVELIMILAIAVGTGSAVAAVGRTLATRRALAPAVREIWLRYAAWILLALEFALAADLIRTVVAPSWKDIGQLASIAAIRTALAFFLARDIAEFGREPQHSPSDISER
jgi:uncharacterized membrane protein